MFVQQNWICFSIFYDDGIEIEFKSEIEQDQNLKEILLQNLPIINRSNNGSLNNQLNSMVDSDDELAQQPQQLTQALLMKSQQLQFVSKPQQSLTRTLTQQQQQIQASQMNFSLSKPMQQQQQ